MKGINLVTSRQNLGFLGIMPVCEGNYYIINVILNMKKLLLPYNKQNSRRFF